MLTEEPMYREIPPRTTGGDRRDESDIQRKKEWREWRAKHPTPWYLKDRLINGKKEL